MNPSDDMRARLTGTPMRRRNLLRMAAAASVAAVLAACGGSTATDTPKPAGTTAPSGTTAPRRDDRRRCRDNRARRNDGRRFRRCRNDDPRGAPLQWHDRAGDDRDDRRRQPRDTSATGGNLR